MVDAMGENIHELERRESAYDSEIRYADEFVKRIYGRFDLGGDAGLNNSGIFLARATDYQRCGNARPMV